MIWYSAIFLLLLGGFLLLFRRVRWLEMLMKFLQQTREGVDEATRKRLLSSRRNLLTLQREHSLWYRLEQNLHYSGWKRRFPFLTAELWMLGNIIAIAMVFPAGMLLFGKWWWACGLVAAMLGTEWVMLWLCRLKELHSVNENLLKFLNFLGNYSITAGEITSIFNQVSRYVDEPMKSVLTECCFEAQTTGDAGQALISMAEKVEHPKLKELVRNMEVSLHYCADFSMLVSGSRRSVREYLRLGEERKEMLREAVISMALLLAMSLFALMTVDGLIQTSVWDILRNTLPGRGALLILLTILILLVRQVSRAQK